MMLSPADLLGVAKVDLGKTGLVTKGSNLMEFI